MSKNNQFCDKCNKKLEIIFRGDKIQYPVFSCPEHGEMKNEWERWYDEYSTRWQEKERWLKNNEKLSCLIGYFCHKFFEFYGFSYTFDISNPIPYKNKDFMNGRKILSLLDNDAIDAKIYIRWVFEKKIVTTKRKITSLGFFVSSQFVNEYKYIKSQNTKITRSTELPNEFLNWCKNNTQIFEKHSLKTVNDLVMLISYSRKFPLSESEEKVLNEAVNFKLIEKENNKYIAKGMEE